MRMKCTCGDITLFGGWSNKDRHFHVIISQRYWPAFAFILLRKSIQVSNKVHVQLPCWKALNYGSDTCFVDPEFVRYRLSSQLTGKRRTGRCWRLTSWPLCAEVKIRVIAIPGAPIVIFVQFEGQAVLSAIGKKKTSACVRHSVFTRRFLICYRQW